MRAPPHEDLSQGRFLQHSGAALQQHEQRLWRRLDQGALWPLPKCPRQPCHRGNTGSQQVDQLLTTLKPKAEAVASEAMSIAVEKLRNGDRKTMIGILGAAAFLGWIASRQSKPIRK